MCAWWGCAKTGPDRHLLPSSIYFGGGQNKNWRIRKYIKYLKLLLKIHVIVWNILGYSLRNIIKRLKRSFVRKYCGPHTPPPRRIPALMSPHRISSTLFRFDYFHAHFNDASFRLQ
jgi:hypothetical protein